MPKFSAGILLYRFRGQLLEVFLVHPGGPFWAKKDAGAWSLPKGEYAEGEDAWVAAQREFKEETGHVAPIANPLALGEVKYSNKLLTAWAVEGDIDPNQIKSNFFTMQWPPRSGKTEEFPEVDKAGWFDGATARQKVVKGQGDFIIRLEEK